MLEAQEVLERYVPALVRRRLAAGAGGNAWAESGRGAVLFADITGSTALAERLAERGPAGAEELGRILNAFFGSVIEVVVAHGGDVIKFAGDGLFAFWSAEDAGEVAAAVRAGRCALTAQAALGALAPGGETRLSMRIGLGLGEVGLMAVGAPHERLDFVMVGPPVAQACDAERQAEPGAVVASPEAWSLIGPHARGVPLSAGATRIDGMDAEVGAGDAGGSFSIGAGAAGLRHFAPPALLPRFDAGHSDWLAEMRNITALFVQLPDWWGGTLAAAQDTVGVVHAALGRYQGSLVRLGMDARGPVVKAAFGVPPQAHEDDPARAVQAALEIRDGLAARGLPVAIGLATGRSFCGEVGNDRRREYTTVGEVVHRSARLMQSSHGDVLCDAATRDACAKRFEFAAAAEPLSLKGLSAPVAVYRPRGRAGSTAAPARAILGRTEERSRLRQCLGELDSGGARVVVIEGEAGLGKSRLVQEVVAEARVRDVTALVGAGDAIEAATPYHAWRPILVQLLALDPAQSGSARLAALQRASAELGEQRVAGASLASLLPLLNPVLGTDLPETEVSAQITGEARADTTHEVMIHLLQVAARDRPHFFVFEDAHWLDSASWAVLELMASRLRPLLAIIATRPMQEPLPPAYRRLLQAAETEILRLALLGRAESAQLVADRLGVSSVAEQIVAFVQERAGGHPFFTEELTQALRETGVVHISGQQCRVAPEAGDLHRLLLPQTVEATLTGRMDALEARQQLLLKVASIFGRNFSSAVLRDVHPLEADRLHIEADLELLESRDLIHRNPTEGPHAYLFKHAITRDVAYDRMAFAQRRQLHRGVAEWYERAHAGDANAPLLAYHWSRAVDPASADAHLGSRALDALESAGEQAVTSYANGEAVQFFEDALRLQESLHASVDSRRLARWHRHLADATNRLGKIPEAIDHALRALDHFGQPFPRGNGRQIAGIARQLSLQMVHRLRSPQRRGLHGAARDQALDAAHLYELLGLMWYVTLDSVPATLANLRAINLAERAGPSPELATSSAMIGLSAGVLLGPRYSEHYFRSGQEAARRVGDRYGHGRICYTRGLVYTGDARWDEATRSYEEALATFSDIGEARWRDIASIMMGSMSFLHRRYGDARGYYEAAARSPQERGDIQAQAWVSGGFAACLLVEGRSAEALVAYEQLASWLANNFAHLADRGSELIMLAIRAAANHRLGRAEEALEALEENLRLVRQAPALTCYVLPGYTYAAEVALRLWESGEVRRERVAPLALEAVANLERFARLYRIGQPAAKLWRGVAHWLRGRHRRAHASWQKALALARAHDMAHEEGLAEYEIGRHLSGTESAARLARAAEIFSGARLTYELERLGAEGAVAVAG